jgi:hypothetical protein
MTLLARLALMVFILYQFQQAQALEVRWARRELCLMPGSAGFTLP